MKLSETTVGVLIGAGATMGGSLVTGLLAFLVDSRRRRWEDRRRWDEPRRRAYANFLEAARRSYENLDNLLETLIRRKELGQRLEAAEHEQGDPPGDAEFEAELQAITTRIKTIGSRIDEWSHQFGEASAEIYVIASRPVQDKVKAQAEVLRRFGGSSWSERESWTTDQLRARRRELRKRWWEASEDFQQAVAKELRIESHRRWWQVWKR